MRCQREDSVLLCTLEPRSLEELEGSLLDPNAFTSGAPQHTSWHASGVPGSPTTVEEMDDDSTIISKPSVRFFPSIFRRGVSEGSALPSDYFQYKVEDEIDDDGKNFEQSLIKMKQMAESLRELNDDTPAAVLISTKEKARVGSEVGRLAAAKEREMTMAASRQARSKPYHEKSRIEAAKKIARQRSREGFSVKKQDEYCYTDPVNLLEKKTTHNDKAFIKKGSWSYDVPTHRDSIGATRNHRED
jgi:hypothetical protein